MYFKLATFLLLASTAVDATTIISKNTSTSSESVYQYIQSTDPYNSFNDEVIVVDMETGDSEAFMVNHEYNYEFYTDVTPSDLSDSVKANIKDDIQELKTIYTEAGSSFFDIPQQLHGVDVSVTSPYSFTKSDVQAHIAGKIKNLVDSKVDFIQTLASTVALKLPDAEFKTRDGGTYQVAVEYGRLVVTVTILKITDKYGNIINTDLNALKDQDYRFAPGASGTDITALIAYLKNMGMLVTTGANVSYGGDVPSGSAVIIDCRDINCVVKRT